MKVFMNIVRAVNIINVAYVFHRIYLDIKPT